MKPFGFVSLSCAVAALFLTTNISHADFSNHITGSGNVVTQTRSVGGYQGIELGGTGRVIVDQDGRESLSITADDNVLPYITSTVRDGVLVLDIKPNTNIQNLSHDIVYRVSAKTLKSLEISGSGTIEATGINTSSLAIKSSGSSKITTAGSATQLYLSVSGSGDYSGNNLKSKATFIDISGAGSADVATSDSLTVQISGSGSIRYLGNPTVIKSISGSGSIEKE